MKNLLILSAIVGLSACSGGNRGSGSVQAANGDISRACLAADRSAATPALCSCVQGVANAELSSNDRNRVARFFADPEVANETKISNTDSDDAFWDRYRTFIASAQRQCS